MKVSKIFGFVLCLHLGVITVLIVQPGCRTTQPPTQTYQQDRTIRTNVKGATRVQEGLIPATRIDTGSSMSEGSSLDAAFNAGIDTGTNVEFSEFNDVPSLAPITPVVSNGPTVNVAGTSFESYTVKKGDSLWGISKRYNVSLNELYAANGLNKSSVLKIGQQIQIPVEGSAATVSTVTADTYQPTSFNSGSETYTVKAGDSLSKIANQFNSSVRAIKAANGKTNDMIRVGETLVIPVSGHTGSTGSTTTVAPSASKVSAPAPSVSASTFKSNGSTRTHTVKAGEFPATIARQYGMTSGELLALNGITDPRSLQIGQVLNVSASGSAANIATSTETIVAPRAATSSSSTATTTYKPATSQGPVQIRVVEADPLIESEAATIDADSMFDNAVEIPVIRMDEE